MTRRIHPTFFLEGSTRRSRQVGAVGYHVGPRSGTRALMQTLCWLPMVYIAYRFVWLDDVKTYDQTERWGWCALILTSLWIMGMGARDFHRMNPGVWRRFFDILGRVFTIIIIAMVAHAVYRHLRDAFKHSHHHFDEPPAFYRY